MTRPAGSMAKVPLVLAAWLLGTPLVSAEAPVLASADARIVLVSPTSCRVDLTLRVDAATQVEHRIEAGPGTEIALIDVLGATKVRDPRTVGRTRALVLSPTRPAYTVRYAVQQPASGAYRCPLWLPTVPADGRSRSVRLQVSLPPGATAAGTMPAFLWAGAEGTATLGHLPAFVRVPYSSPGTAAPWDVARGMDLVTVAVILGASAAWARRARSR